jgi:hypothetical protein
MYKKYGVKVMSEAYSTRTVHCHVPIDFPTNVTPVALSRFGSDSYIKPRKRAASSLPLVDDGLSATYPVFKPRSTNDRPSFPKKPSAQSAGFSIFSEVTGASNQTRKSDNVEMEVEGEWGKERERAQKIEPESDLEMEMETEQKKEQETKQETEEGREEETE